MKTAKEIYSENLRKTNCPHLTLEQVMNFPGDNSRDVALKSMEEYLQQYKDSLNPVDQTNFASEPITTINEGGENREEK